MSNINTTKEKAQATSHLYIVRHGQSEGQLDPNKYKTIGDTDLQLTPEGHVQAIQAAKIIVTEFKAAQKEVLVYHSNSVRARQTAEHIHEALENANVPTLISSDPRINKQSFGIFDGLFTKEERRAAAQALYDQFDKMEQMVGAQYARPPQGESVEDVYRRAASFIKERASEKNKENIIVVTHGLVAECLTTAVTNGLGQQINLASADATRNCEIKRFKDFQSLLKF